MSHGQYFLYLLDFSWQMNYPTDLLLSMLLIRPFQRRIKKIFNSGLSTLLISIYDGKKEADDMEKLLKDCDLTEEQYKVRHRYLPESESFGITLSNRSGMMEKAEYVIPSLKEPMKRPCYYPHYTFFMDYTGEVLICSHDWGKKNILGNFISDQKLTGQN